MSKKIGYGRMPESRDEFGEQLDALLNANCDLKICILSETIDL